MRRPIDKAVCVAPLLDGFAKALALLRLVFGTLYMLFSSYKGGLSFTTERFACMLLSNLPIHNMADYLLLVVLGEQVKHFRLVLTKNSENKSPRISYGFSFSHMVSADISSVIHSLKQFNVIQPLAHNR